VPLGAERRPGGAVLARHRLWPTVVADYMAVRARARGLRRVWSGAGANWKHGLYSKQALAEKDQMREVLRNILLNELGKEFSGPD
jgi:hypothetical protein